MVTWTCSGSSRETISRAFTICGLNSSALSKLSTSSRIGFMRVPVNASRARESSSAQLPMESEVEVTSSGAQQGISAILAELRAAAHGGASRGLVVGLIDEGARAQLRAATSVRVFDRREVVG